jgi:phosphodiesterase/alkaline phosphatase D-like protein
MFKKSIIVFLLVMLVIPTNLFAATTGVSTYQPRTTNEMIAYLYGRISQLMELQQMLGGQNNNSGATTQSSLGYVLGETRTASDVLDTSAILRGEVTLYGNSTATAWFEYGQDSDFLDQKTRHATIKSAYDRAVRIQVKNLESDDRYYFRVVTQDKNKIVKYGEVFAFRTDESDE